MTWSRAAAVTTAVAAMVALPDAALAAHAPFKFEGRTSQHLDVVFQIPWSFVGVRKFAIDWNAKCTSGARLEATSAARGTLRFNRAGPGWNQRAKYDWTQIDPDYSASNGRKLTFLASIRNTGRTRRDDVVGTWKAVVTVADPATGLGVDTCRTGRVTWRADFV